MSNDLKSENVLKHTPIQASSSFYIMTNTMLPFIDEDEEGEETESNETVEVVVVTGEIPTVSGSVEIAIKRENDLHSDFKFHKKLIHETKKSCFSKEKKHGDFQSILKCLFGWLNIFYLLFKICFSVILKVNLNSFKSRLKEKRALLRTRFPLLIKIKV
jgi:hypothetical protein